MSEAPDHHHDRAARQEAARSRAHEAADQRRAHRRHGEKSEAAARRWRFTDAVQAARALGAGGTS